MLTIIAIIIIVHWARKTTREENIAEEWNNMFKHD